MAYFYIQQRMQKLYSKYFDHTNSLFQDTNCIETVNSVPKILDKELNYFPPELIPEIVWDECDPNYDGNEYSFLKKKYNTKHLFMELNFESDIAVATVFIRVFVDGTVEVEAVADQEEDPKKFDLFNDDNYTRMEEWGKLREFLIINLS